MKYESFGSTGKKEEFVFSLDRILGRQSGTTNTKTFVSVPKKRLRHLRIAEFSNRAFVKKLTQDCLEAAQSHGVSADDWATGIEAEIVFWLRSMSKNMRRRNNHRYKAKFLLDRPFEYADLLNESGAEVDVLDIGCALKPGFGRRLGDKKINVKAADPLAPAYNFMLQSFGIEQGYELQWGVAEMTADIFGEGAFDFILAKNSIDHGFDPALAFNQIARALKPGGKARFEHWENEASYQGYEGFHQWNIEPSKNNRLRVWNRDSETLVDFQDFGCVADIRPVDKPKLNGFNQPAFEVIVSKEKQR